MREPIPCSKRARLPLLSGSKKGPGSHPIFSPTKGTSHASYQLRKVPLHYLHLKEGTEPTPLFLLQEKVKPTPPL